MLKYSLVGSPLSITASLLKMNSYVKGFSGGQPFKRHEFVEFPAVLTMEKYLYSTQLIKQKSIASLIGTGNLLPIVMYLLNFFS